MDGKKGILFVFFWFRSGCKWIACLIMHRKQFCFLINNIFSHYSFIQWITGKVNKSYKNQHINEVSSDFP